MEFGRGKTWWSLVAPEGMLVAASWALPLIPPLRAAVARTAILYAFSVCALGAVVAWRLRRGRVLFALMVLALATWALTHVGTGAGERLVVAATGVLLPINLAVLALMPDRGVFGRFAIIRLSAIAAQVGLVLVFRDRAPATLIRTLTQGPLPPGLLAWTSLTQPALCASLLAAVATSIPLVFESNPGHRGFLWAILAATLGLAAHRPGARAPIYLGTAGLILIVVTLEMSYRLAYQDGLTGLPGRRALNEELAGLRGSYAVAMVDVDHFKQFNDRYGHDAGDQVLRMVAAKLARVAGGRAYRYGGEEFAILFSGPATDALPHLEALRADVAESRFGIRRLVRRRTRAARDGRTRRVSVAVTISIGVAEPGGRESAAEDVIRAADRALYRAKTGGRNRVCS